MASPASAQETPCPDTWLWDTIGTLTPAVPEEFVELTDETITIRGDLAVSAAARLAAHYESTIDTFVGCAASLALARVAPYADCVQTEAAPILTSPDPVGRYLQVDGLVVRVHYAQLVNDAAAMANCNGIVTYGG